MSSTYCCTQTAAEYILWYTYKRRTQASGSCESQGDVGQGWSTNTQWLVSLPLYHSSPVQRLQLDPEDVERAQKMFGSEGEETLLPADRHFGTAHLTLFKVLSSWASLHSIYHKRSAEGEGRETGRVQRGILHSTTAFVAKHQESQKEDDRMRC